jgi:AcrR family transcriptional regulator
MVRTSPRKTASQQWSRITVNALPEATARILVREGLDKASTNRIAEVAGVSVETFNRQTMRYSFLQHCNIATLYKSI